MEKDTFLSGLLRIVVCTKSWEFLIIGINQSMWPAWLLPRLGTLWVIQKLILNMHRYLYVHTSLYLKHIFSGTRFLGTRAEICSSGHVAPMWSRKQFEGPTKDPFSVFMPWRMEKFLRVGGRTGEWWVSPLSIPYKTHDRVMCLKSNLMSIFPQVQWDILSSKVEVETVVSHCILRELYFLGTKSFFAFNFVENKLDAFNHNRSSNHTNTKSGWNCGKPKVNSDYVIRTCPILSSVNQRLPIAVLIIKTTTNRDIKSRFSKEEKYFENYTSKEHIEIILLLSPFLRASFGLCKFYLISFFAIQ